MGVDTVTYEKYAVLIEGIHNMWLKELMQGGVFSVIALLVLLVFSLNNAAKCLYANASCLSAKLKIVMVFAILLSTQFNPSGTSVFWFFMGYCAVNICVKFDADDIKNDSSNLASREEGLATPNRVLSRRRSSAA